jgi:hypothetical protein
MPVGSALRAFSLLGLRFHPLVYAADANDGRASEHDDFREVREAGDRLKTAANNQGASFDNGVELDDGS